MKFVYVQRKKCTSFLTSAVTMRIATLITISTFATGADARILPFHGSSKVVYPQLLEERTADSDLVLYITDGLVLNLKKSSVASPHLRVISSENGTEEASFYDGEEIESTIYQDMEKQASVSIIDEGIGIEVEGLISPELRIEPVSEDVRSRIDLIPHMIHVINAAEEPENVTYNHTFSGPLAITARSSANPQGAPENVQVEIVVISDTYHSKFFKNKTKLITYICLIVNTVNIRLSATRDPKIQLLLTGVEVSVDEPYMLQKGDIFNAEDTVQALGRYAFQEKVRLGNPDTLFLLTGRDAYGKRGGREDRSLRGLGYDNGICSDWFVALGEDKAGTFSGTDTFAHEVGHLLGASHDGQPPDRRYPGRPGAEHCPITHGYLMSYVKLGPVSHHYSPCSLAQMKYIVTQRGPSCWKVTATPTYNVTKKYPGMVVSAEMYCERKLPTKKNVVPEPTNWFISTCMIRCLYNENDETAPNRHDSYQDFDALEYTPCGEGQVCIQGQCVADPKKRKKDRT